MRYKASFLANARPVRGRWLVALVGVACLAVILVAGLASAPSASTGTSATAASTPAAATTTAAGANVTTATLMAATIARPVDANYWWGYQEWYSRSYVRQYANWYNAVQIAKLACNGLPVGAKQVCDYAVGKYLSKISSTWQKAKNANECLTVKELWTGQVTSISAYRCSWN